MDLDPNIDLNAEAKLNGAEILQLSEDMINPNRTKLGPQDFELKKVLGRGGYGKVFQVSFFKYLYCPKFECSTVTYSESSDTTFSIKLHSI